MGKNYHGWQVQPNAISVQAVLEEKLSFLLGEKIEIVGAGRTDAGVHARNMIAHFDVDELKYTPENLVHRLNAFLPYDIAIHNLFEVHNHAHARFDAILRTYEYRIHTEKNPFLKEFSWEISHIPLQIEAMNHAAATLLDTTDFTSFAKLHADNKTNLCQVQQAYFVQQGKEIVFTISADRFLRNMVRAIVGTLVDVGMGKIDQKQFQEIIQKKGRNFAAASAPAQGLYLTAVKYPESIWK